jgi:hypothetical protein
VAVPTRWETFSYVTREALAANRPVLATAAGAIVEVVKPGESGWLAESSSPEHLRDVLERVLGSRDELDRMIRDGRPRKLFERSDNGAELLAAYGELAGRERTGAQAGEGAPVHASAIVAAEPDGPPAARTLRALRDQRGARVETVLVGTGEPLHLDATDLVLVDRYLSCPAPAGGRTAAWLAGAAAATHDLLLLVPAGTEIEPDFVATAAAALHAAPELAYATSFVAGGREPWHAPGGNYRMPAEADIAASVALVRASAFADLGSDGDSPPDESSLFNALARLGHIGVVVQEPLVARLPRRSGVVAAGR